MPTLEENTRKSYRRQLDELVLPRLGSFHCAKFVPMSSMRSRPIFEPQESARSPSDGRSP